MSSLASAAKRLRPLLDRVLVEKVVPPTVSAGGILLPETTTKVPPRPPSMPFPVAPLHRHAPVASAGSGGYCDRSDTLALLKQVISGRNQSYWATEFIASLPGSSSYPKEMDIGVTRR